MPGRPWVAYPVKQTELEEVEIMAVFEQLQGWGYKNDCISGTVGLINTKFGHSIPEGVPYH